MSVRFTTVDAYTASTGLPTSNVLTVTFWLYISVDRNAFSAIFHLTDSTSVNVAFLSTLGDGTTLVTIDSAGSQGGNTAVPMTVGTWYRVGLVVNGTNTTLYTGTATGSLTSSSGTTASATVPFFLTIGDTLNGRVAALKVWNNTLTATEVTAELETFDAVRTTDLLRAHPFHVAETTDYSGNGNTLNVTGTGAGISTEADPPAAGAFGNSAGSVTLVASSTPTPAGTTTTATTVSITPTLPTGSASGDRVYVVQAGNNTAGTTPTSWTAVGKDIQVGPTGTAPGAGTGRRYLSVYYRDYDGAWTMPAFTLTSAAQNTHALSAITLRKAESDTWDTPAISTAGNTSAATTAYSVTTGSVAAPSGMVIVGVATNDNVTASAETLTGAAATFSSLAEQSDTGSATGNDVAIHTYTANVLAGGTGTITHTVTLSGASEGGTVVVAQPSTAHPPQPQPSVVTQAALLRANTW